MRNNTPFWKEPSLKHVWYRLNDGAKVMLYTVLFLVACGLVAWFVSEIAAFNLLVFGISFALGRIYHDMSKPVWIKNDVTGKYERIQSEDD